MFPRTFFAGTFFAPRYWGEGGAAPAPAPTGSRGRRLVRWLIESSRIDSPVGDWVRQREDEEELFILG